MSSPRTKKPEKAPVIAILSYDRVELLRRCLESIFKSTQHPHEICVVDQASSDGTREYLAELGDRVHHLKTESNLGFVLGNNLVMERFADRDIVLLNNDTEVESGWLTSLVERAYSDVKIGITGAKLVFPDGRLQAAGCEIFSDASGREIGKFDDPERFIYNQVKDVDYCSGASLYIKRETLDKTGNLDPQFAPAYWEDTDLCFAARKAGYRVVYEPKAVVNHHEGGSFGAPEAGSQSAELQARNKPKFIAKWIDEITERRANVYEIPAVEGKEKILVILPFPAMYDRASGERRWFSTLELLTQRYQVVLLARNGVDGIKYINALEKMGITVFHTDTEKMRHLGHEVSGPVWIDFPKLLQSNDFKAVIAAFYHVAAQYYREIRQYSPQSLLVVDSVDAAFLREWRKAEVSGRNEDYWSAEEVRRLEVDWYRKFDMTLAVTDADRQVLLEEEPSLQIAIMPDIHALPKFERPKDSRGLVFVGNFNHPPNGDAVVHFVGEVLPRIHRELPEVKFYVVGNNPTPEVQALSSDKVIVTGFVPEVLPYLQQCRVCVVPLRYGAGLKGKVAQAMAAGIPQVTTAIGAEGTAGVHGRDFLLADSDEDFAQAVIRLYQDPKLQNTLAENGRKLVASQCSVENAELCWQEVFDAIEHGRQEIPQPAPGRRSDGGYQWLEPQPKIVPIISIVIPAHDNLQLTQNCWMSIRQNTKLPHEILIVDNGSNEALQDAAQQHNIRCIRNEENLGFAAAVNQGIRGTRGDIVVVLNNDTIVTPGWLERLTAHLRGDARIGIVAPMTNYANTEQMIPGDYNDEESLYRFSNTLHRKNKGRAKELRKVAGVCMVMPRRVIEEVGLFDTRFGLGNYEDDDYCIRTLMAGYKIVCAQDVFIHHEGGMTFKKLGIDYEKLLKQNSEIFLQKWVTLVNAGQKAQASKNDSEVTVLLYQDEEEMTLAGIEALVESLPPNASLRLLCQASEIADLCENAGIPVVRTSSEGAYASIDREIRDAGTPCIVAVSSRVRGESAWVEQLLEVAAEQPRAGLVCPQYVSGIAQSNKARANGKSWQAISEPNGTCLLVRKESFVEVGGLSPEFRSVVAWTEMSQRLAERQWQIGCATRSHVRSTPASGTLAAIDPKERKAVQLLAQAKKKIDEGASQEALQLIEESLQRKHDYVLALYHRSQLRLEQGKAAEAQADLQNILQINPRYSPAHNDLGCLAFEDENDAAATNYFQTAVELDPDNMEAARNLGDLYFSQSKLEEAMSVYVDIVKKVPEDPQTYINLGQWFERLGEVAGASDWYKQALKVAPDCHQAERLLQSVSP